jgi:2-hydroxy-6-oxonona-2,4-dienedioate hydrolase
LHGGVGSASHWIRNLPVLAERFRVIAFDLPGYGNSPDVPRGMTPDQYVDWVTNAVTVAAPDRCHLAGFSFGGALAARVAAQLGGRVVRLSLLGSGGFGVPVGRNIPTTPVPGPEAGVAARRAAAAANLGQWMLSTAPAPDDPIVDMQLSNIDRTRFDSRRISLRATLLDDLARIPAAVQMIWGTEDKLAHPSVQSRADACHAVRDDIKISFVPGGGHWIQYEHATSVNQQLMDFHTASDSDDRLKACSH